MFGLTTRNRPGPGRDGAGQRVNVDGPPAVVIERVRKRPDAVERRQVLEQRIAGAGHQHLVARVAQQLEEEAVGLARAGGQDDAGGIEVDAVPEGVERHRLTRHQQAARRRVVAQAGRIGERREQPRRVVDTRA